MAHPWLCMVGLCLALGMAGGQQPAGSPEELQSSILLECLGPCQGLRHSSTQEIAMLPLVDPPWDIAYSAGGAYLHRPGEVQWASRHLEATLHRVGGKLFVVHPPAAQSTWLSDWLSGHWVMFIKLPRMAVEGVPAILKACWMTVGFEGCQLMWGMRYLHSFLALDGRWDKPSLFFKDNFARWREALEKEFGLGPLHLRHASGKLRSRAPGDASDFTKVMCLQEVTCSTAAMLLLLAKWSASSGKSLAGGASHLLHNLLGAFMKDPGHIYIYMHIYVHTYMYMYIYIYIHIDNLLFG